MENLNQKYEKIFVYFCLFWPLVLVPIVAAVGISFGSLGYADIVDSSSNIRPCSLPLYQSVFSLFVILSCCSCQLCICGVYMKCRESSWRKQQQQQQQQPHVVVENPAAHERDLLVSPTQSLPPSYNAATGRVRLNNVHIEQTGFQ